MLITEDQLINNKNNKEKLIRNAKKDVSKAEYSPMDPPDAYKPPRVEEVPYEQMHPFLQKLTDDHVAFKKQLDQLETAIQVIQETGITKEADKSIRDFFAFFDEDFLEHSKKEEKEFFPLLHKRLIAAGEHSQGIQPLSAVDALEDDHVKMLQLGALVFNFFALASRLPDKASRVIVLDTAVQQAVSLVELIRLHIFREDNAVFGLAHKFISQDEFSKMRT